MDTTKVISGGGNPASSFIDFIWNDFVAKGSFWGTMMLIFLFLWIGRTFIFENKNIKLNEKSWFYPLYFLGFTALAVWLTNEAPNPFTKKYTADFLITLGVMCMCYVAFGHKMVVWLSTWSTERLNLRDGYQKKETTLVEETDKKKVTTEVTQTTQLKDEEKPKD